jgi:putative endonuclease
VPDPRHALGQAAEDAVGGWLTARGWRVLARRHRSRTGAEVDLIALDPGGTLVAIEVRARRTRRAGRPEETLDGIRVGRIERTLAAYAAGHPRQAGMRIDLVSVEIEPAPGGAPRRWRLRRFPDVGGR